MDIINLPIEYNTAKIDSRFRLVVLASQRARELALGAEPKIQTFSKQKETKGAKQREHKVTTLSILEVVAEKFDYLQGIAAVEARQRAEKMDLKRFGHDKDRITRDISESELEKDLKVYLHEKEVSKRGIGDYFSETDDYDQQYE
ncbi:MAG: DNA-directed RNA polymerase subunit omega [Thermodesulfovibrionales bacterium]|nr:DNA-directed RNA polymerase subunit omega [Thermodesulfovibrionales bacterium]